MIRLLTLLLFCIASTAAQAQTTFSFSGLAWGDSVDQVVAKLKAANLPPTSWTERLTCRVRSDCTLRFEGAVSGIAEFKGNGLSFVWISSTSDAAAVEARRATLERRYGKPLPGPAGTPIDNILDSDSFIRRWRSPTGETLQIGSGGDIQYTSGTSGKTKAAAEVKF